MTDYNNILKVEPFALSKEEKRQFLMKQVNELTRFHYEHCISYTKVLDFLGYDRNKMYSLETLPFLPIRMFKEFEMLSVSKEEVFKRITSSGTTGQSVSEIFLDKETALNQQKTLIRIMGDFIPEMRMPMIILDTERVIRDRNFFSARKAGILGFSLFARDKIYALDDEMNLDIPALQTFLAKHSEKPILVFGYTFMIWQYFYQELFRRGMMLDFSNAILIHGGGWKKLQNLNISVEKFKRGLYEVCGVKKIHDYYGMVEQTGTIYMTCENGYMHTSVYSDIITRRAEDFSICEFEEKGIVQLISLIPRSYPGHNLLTEDEAIILGEDDCPCGRKGKYFKISGRIQNAEVRGCSDTYAGR
ncbi:acyl-protein synthetase [Clostridiales bacterium COT073_COT-073]|nr:acyl-protein synthetase [Clostridiales bacterium COT073_COT-073]